MAYGTQDVKSLYEKYPYPSPFTGDSLIPDNVNMISSLFPGDDLANKKILDAGCGTGHRFLAVAKRYRKATCVGIDVTPSSLAIARKLAEKNRMQNMRFRQADLLNLDIDEKFDVIYSSGVIHHLENPERGLQGLSRLLKDDGVMIIWLYHSLGEHQRLLDRELLLTLSGDGSTDLQRRFEIMRALELKLEIRRYGSSSSQSKDEVNQNSIDADAYMHPIVNAYRFKEAIELFADADVDWVAANAVNMPERSVLINLEEVDSGLSDLVLKTGDLFDSPLLVESYRSVDKLAKLAVIELILKPTGLTVIAGKNSSFLKFGKRIEGNLVPLSLMKIAKSNLAAIESNSLKEDPGDFEF